MAVNKISVDTQKVCIIPVYFIEILTYTLWINLQGFKENGIDLCPKINYYIQQTVILPYFYFIF